MPFADSSAFVLTAAIAIASIAAVVLLAHYLVPRAAPRPLPAVPVGTGVPGAPSTPAVATAPANFMPPPMALAPPALHNSSDRRITYRRVGNPVLAQVLDAERASSPRHAWVIDRSRQGLRLAFEHPVNSGTVLNIRIANAPEQVPWLPVEVRNCEKHEGYFELGCRFPDPPTWETLLLFG